MASSIQTDGIAEEVLQRRLRAVRKPQNGLLIWLDKNINNSDRDIQNTITKLNEVCDVNTYTDSEECIQFIEKTKDREVSIIMSGLLGQHVISRVHDLVQVNLIFIFCRKKIRYEQWAKEWPKIKGVFTKIVPICEALTQATQHCEQKAIPISFVPSGKKLDQLDPSFMYTQIIKEILLTIDFNDKHLCDYVNYCRELFADNEKELDIVTQLESTYYQETPIWWYTRDCFLYRMLNRGIRVIDGNIMTRMGFFISDLHRRIERLHREQSYSEAFTLYRGRGLSTKDFERLQETNGGLMSFNSFLSTSKVRKVSLHFAQRTAANPDTVGVLFVMQIDPKLSSTPFAAIRDFSCYSHEDEVLFSTHSVFRIRDIQPMDETNRLYEVSLTLTNDNDTELGALTEYMRSETFPDEKGWYRLGSVLMKLNQNETAESIYRNLLDQTENESDKTPIYRMIGSTKTNCGKFQEAMECFKKALHIEKKTLVPQRLQLIRSFVNIGSTYHNMGNNRKALAYYKKLSSSSDTHFLQIIQI
ncbi:unnamed protein product [Adineta ricciae]|uniref:NAD(P)(+)--arginine ADP-ribosyltransferase n=1 Tax=Adineta ricciae TaxID=249248 RepID=A0A815CY81_ADIRI|nr:unnamed protein product [Adineta ricciae]